MSKAGDIRERGASRNRAVELFGADGLPIAQAHDAVDAGSNLKIGGVARADFDAAVADLDRTDAMFDRQGRQITCPYCPPDEIVQARQTATNTTATLLAAVAGERYYITTFVISAENGSIDWEIRDGAAGTVMFSGELAQGQTEDIVCPTPARFSVNTLIEISAVGLGNTLHVSAVGFSLAI